MSPSEKSQLEGDGARGMLGGFFRRLLSGIPWSERAEATERLSLKAPPRGGIRIDNSNGYTHVVGEDRQEIEIEARKTARAENEEAAQRMVESIRVVASEELDPLELTVEIPKRWNRHGSVHLEVRVPRKMPVHIHSSNGGVAVEGVRGPVRARSSNGSVTITDVIGDIDLSTSNGKVLCSATCGQLVARSSNRKIEVKDHAGSLDAMTSNGVIRASLKEVGPEGILLATSNGRIVLELPQEVDAEIDLRVDNGVIRNQRTLCRCTRDTTGRVRGSLGNGGASIKLRTSNGSITLR